MSIGFKRVQAGTIASPRGISARAHLATAAREMAIHAAANRASAKKNLKL